MFIWWGKQRDLETLLIQQGIRIFNLEQQNKEFEKKFEEIRLRLSKPTPDVTEFKPRTRGADWLVERDKLEAEHASKQT